MANQLEEIFNECFERLLSGESLDSCLRRYPQHAAELDQMLRMAFDVKRRAYPIQPRPEFKYWARVRMHGVQDYLSKQPVESGPSIFHWRRSWAVALSAIMAFVLATGGTAAASSQAMPDQPLYGVKMAVEQAQIALTFSEVDKAELHAELAEKRAQEVAVMANQGKTDKIVTTMANMNRHLEDLENSLQKVAATNAAQTVPAETVTPPSPTTTPSIVAPQPTVTAPLVTPQVTVPETTATTPAGTVESPVPSTTTVTPQVTTPVGKDAADNRTKDTRFFQQQPPKTVIGTGKAAIDTNKARSINANTAKSITVLQNALQNAPDSVKPTIKAAIERARKANEQVQTPSTKSIDSKTILPNININRGKDNMADNATRKFFDGSTPSNLPNKPRLIPSTDKPTTSSGTVNTATRDGQHSTGSSAPPVIIDKPRIIPPAIKPSTSTSTPGSRIIQDTNTIIK
ncbi:MAG: DUF5667 domain-containing protein [Dehalococcoidia bacterium]|nr:DUF5667 domain-containing protein [Dehalococcoidia bacterium]MDD5494802.1 DUF5667 domain-containing protein [Dehalococcoidia bacterium]